MTQQKEEYQLQEIEYVLNAKSLVIAEEWKEIIEAGEKDIKKEVKRVNKELDKLEDKYSKLFRLIESRIEHLDNKSDAILVFNNIYKTHESYIKEYLSLLENKNSIIYRFEITEDELQFEINKINSLYFATFNSIAEGHEKLVELIQPEDWKKINKQTPDF